jgi:hypothetical protein
MDVSDADCDAHEAWASIDRALTNASDVPAVSAYRAQTAYLDGRRAEWQALQERARQRLKAGLITAVEFAELWRSAEILERKSEEARGMAARLQASGVQPGREPVDALVNTYLQSEKALERQISGLKSLDAWSFKVLGGGIPSSDRTLGWFGWAEISYNFGALFRDHQERHYLSARSAELSSAVYEYPSRIRELKRQIGARIVQARRELSVVEKHLLFLADTRMVLDGVETPNTAQERDALMVEQYSAESDRVFLQAMIDGLTTLIKRDHG